jgi:hypothetical protein
MIQIRDAEDSDYKTLWKLDKCNNCENPEKQIKTMLHIWDTGSGAFFYPKIPDPKPIFLRYYSV